MKGHNFALGGPIEAILVVIPAIFSWRRRGELPKAVLHLHFSERTLFSHRSSYLLQIPTSCVIFPWPKVGGVVAKYSFFPGQITVYDVICW